MTEEKPSDVLAKKIQDGLLGIPGEPEIDEHKDDRLSIIFPALNSHVYVDLIAGKATSKVQKAADKVQEIIDAPDEPETAPRPAVKSAPTPPPSVGGFRKAARKAAKLRLGIAGPSGSGKTMSSLLIGFGICDDWSKIGIIDTENGSGELYVGAPVNGSGVVIGEYNVLTLTPPYTPEKYIAAIKAAEDARLEVVIIDSLTHAWAGEGGMLDLHGKITDSSRSGNSWAAWRQVTPKHNALVEKMLGSPLHVIATIRSKTEYIQEGGQVKKVGMSPVFRDGIEYEFTTFMDLSISHDAVASKDRTNLFAHDEYFRPSPDTGKKLKGWLEAV